MRGRVLLDTNIVIALFGSEEPVVHNVENTREVFVSCVVLGELYYGARKSSKKKENVARINDFAATTGDLSVDVETAREYGKIKNRLRAEGNPIPENDIWIAAHALQHDLALATRDQHFKHIDDLVLLMW